MKRIKFTLQDSRNRLLFLGGLILFMFIAVAIKLLWIQIVRARSWGNGLPYRLQTKSNGIRPGGGSWIGTGKNWRSASWCIPCM